MEIIRIPRVMQDTSKGHILHGRSIGFVPTMGALHEGHLSLVRNSRDENDLTVVSIFINPLQFDDTNDLNSYPRDTENDIYKLRNQGADILFIPDPKQMYMEDYCTFLDIEGISDRLCGQFRKGHFKGVATVVAKLFNIVRPKRAYFGQKDYQQTVVIKHLVKDLNMDIEIVAVPTVRETDGLAMSSRNKLLNTQERNAAATIPRCINEVSDMIKCGIIEIGLLKIALNECLGKEPLINEIQYASFYDPVTLEELSHIKTESLIAVALKIGKIRLIDNLLVKRPAFD